MKETSDFSINGIIESSSVPMEHVEPGMFFHFDGKTLRICPHDPLNDAQIIDIFFNDAQLDQSECPKEDVLITGSMRPSAKSVSFHVSRRPGIKDRGIYFNVAAYWIIENGFELKDISMVRFSGLCIESFCPMTNIETNIGEGYSEITIRTSADNSIDLGTAVVNENKLTISAETYWSYKFREHIDFESRLICKLEFPNYELMKSIYTSFASALRYCLGRGNVDFVLELCIEEGSDFHAVGKFTVLHGRTYVPDELDKPSAHLVRAKDVGIYFGEVVSAFSNGTFYGPELAQSRDDTEIITYSKIIELTSSFEREFRELFPKGIEHKAKTQRDSELAKAAICQAAEGLPSNPKKFY